mmetsp:Transcript_27763/g.37074  ORF Transcript_27763/g.37074 Transcript_27763/m.37074 type:complete len:332 (+) Transcript_27763:43-1038(+)
MHSLDKKSDRVFFTIQRLHSLCLSFQGKHTSANSDQVLITLRRMSFPSAPASAPSAANWLRWRSISVCYGAVLREAAARVLLHVAPTLRALFQAGLSASLVLARSLVPLLLLLLVCLVAAEGLLPTAFPVARLVERLLCVRRSLLHAALQLLPVLNILHFLALSVRHARVGRLTLMRDSRISVADIAVAVWAFRLALFHSLEILLLLQRLLNKLILKNGTYLALRVDGSGARLTRDPFRGHAHLVRVLQVQVLLRLAVLNRSLTPLLVDRRLLLRLGRQLTIARVVLVMEAALDAGRHGLPPALHLFHLMHAHLRDASHARIACVVWLLNL